MAFCSYAANAAPDGPARGGRWSRWTQAAWALLLGAMLVGCASLLPAQKTESFALAPTGAEPLVKVAHASQRFADESMFRPLAFSRLSMDARLTLARLATRSLDVQYYLLQNDQTGRTLLRELRRAALRGVRVRILVDDMYTSSSEELLTQLAATPNIEVRLFNPFPAGRALASTRWLYSLFDFARVNHRMHNKMFIADGAFAVVGGRNIADEYFFRSRTGNFVDFDLLVGGAAVPRFSAIFDTYWNSVHVYALASLSRPDRDAEHLQARFDAATSKKGPFDEAMTSADHDDLGFNALSLDIDKGALRMFHGPIEVFADSPEKVSGRSETGTDPTTVTSHVLKALAQAQSDVVLASPYFVPSREALEALASMRRRGVNITLITNTLAANDEPFASAAYSRYRKRMLKMGIDIYEVSSKRLRANKNVSGKLGTTVGRSHAKIVVIDHETTFVGSMNMDLRSSRENTELGMLVRSRPLADEVLALTDEMRSNGTYRLRLNGDDIVWVDSSNGAEETFTSEPEVDFGTRLKILLFSPFIAESLL